MKSVVVDDEKLAIKRLKKLLKKYGCIDIIDTAQNGKEAINIINDKKPEVVFLDIEMPEYNGFEVIENLDYLPVIVFVTAYNKYAIRAFEVNGVDYLLKPVSRERLDKTISRLVEQDNKLKLKIIDKIKREIGKEDYLKYFTVNKRDEYIVLKEEEVFFFNAEDKYVFLNAFDKKYFYEMTLRKLEERLDPQKFLRIHRGYIIAIDKIEKIKKWFGGRFKVVLSNKANTTLTVSRSRMEEFKKKFEI